MKRARKSSNRVSWATGRNLCQVKLFLSEDFPSKVGQKPPDHLQAKTSSMLHPCTFEDNDLPPGFECKQSLNQSKDALFNIPRTNWRCPPPFVFSNRWQVVAGEESREKEDQKLRELRILEAVYPRLSNIPPSPFISLEVEEEDFDDNLTPIIPLEEEPMDDKPELAAEATDALATVQSLSNTSSSVASPGSEVDLAAAAALVAAIMNTNQQGSLIDMDLLVKVFNDPKLIEQLVNEHKTAATTGSVSSNTVLGTPASRFKNPPTPAPLSTPGEPVGLLSASGMTPAIPLISTSKPAMPSVSSSTPTPDIQMPVKRNYHHMSNRVLPTLDTHPPQNDTILASGAKQAASLMASIPMNSGGNLLPLTNQVPSNPSTKPYQGSTGNSHPIKDASYLKDLIRQHGSDKPHTQDLQQLGIRQSNFHDKKSVHHNKPGQGIYKIPKSCMFFKTPRGCRKGATCPFQHDMTVQLDDGTVLGPQSAKRLKLGPEIKGRI